MNNIERLGNLLSSQMKNTVTGNTSIVAELGSISSNLSLRVASLKNSIPKGQYMISRSLTIGDDGEKLTETDSGMEVIIPETMRSVKAGDRVLVIWVGSEPIVIDIVKSS